MHKYFMRKGPGVIPFPTALLLHLQSRSLQGCCASARRMQITVQGQGVNT